MFELDDICHFLFMWRLLRTIEITCRFNRHYARRTIDIVVALEFLYSVNLSEMFQFLQHKYMHAKYRWLYDSFEILQFDMMFLDFGPIFII